MPTKGPQAITNLAIKSYVTEVQYGSPSGQVDHRFIHQAIEHLKIFILAGHDTTASTLSFTYHLLHTNPAALAALRAEHVAVLGPDPTNASATITASPQLMNQLPYTSAVIKETLRLFPPISSVHSVYPADGAMVLGEQAYQCLLPGEVAGHPKGMMPVKVRLRE